MTRDKTSKDTEVESPKARLKRSTGEPLPRATAVVSEAFDEEAPVVAERDGDDDRFAVTDEIARGGMGRVLAARDLHLDRVVAIKEALGESKTDLSRFAREVRVTAKLQHPGILPLYDAREWPNGAPYYVMRLVDGKPLSEKIRGAVALDERLTLIPNMLAAADAVAFAHEARVIHRDIKPSNILVGQHGDTVVIDWGIAKLQSEEDEGALAREDSSPGDKTRPGASLGTPGYMAPEQVVGDSADERSDVYSLGATLYHLLGGKRPFEGDDSERIMSSQLEGPPVPLADFVQGVPRELLAIVDRALATDAADRYPNAAEFADDLRRFQTGRLVAAHDYSLGERVFRFVRRNRAAVLVAGVATALLAAVTVSSLLGIRAERDRALAASHAEAQRADELLISRSRRLLEGGNPTAAVAVLKHLPLLTDELESAKRVFKEAQAGGVTETILETHRSWAALAWHPREALLLSAGEKRVLIHDFRGPKAETRILHEGEEWLSSAAFVDDYRSIVAAPKAAKLLIINVDTGATEEIMTEHSVVYVAAPGHGEFFVWREADGSLWKRQTTKGSTPQRLGAVGKGDRLRVSRDGSLIAASSSGPATLWKNGTRHEVAVGGWGPLVSEDGELAYFIVGESVVGYKVEADEVFEFQKWEGRTVSLARNLDGDVFAVSNGLRELLADGSTDDPFGDARVGMIYETNVGLVAWANRSLYVTDRSDHPLKLPAGHRGVPAVAAGHGRLAIAEHGGRVSIVSIDALPQPQRSLADVKAVRFIADGELIVSMGAAGQTIVKYDAETDEATVLAQMWF